jgi:hypothetical protein
MKVKYIIDQKFDNKLIWIILNCSDPAGLENRAISMSIPLDMAIEISKSKKYSQTKEKIDNISNLRYEKLGDDFFKEQLISYQTEWNKISNFFLNRVEEITNFKWKHKIFYVVLSPFHIGTTTNGGNIVARSVIENPKSQTRITAHEILMSHLWSYFYENYPDSKNDKSMKFWKLNEITTTLMLGSDSELDKLWIDEQKGIDNFMKNYPQLSKLKYELRDLYVNRSNFETYITQAIKSLEN